MDFIPVFENITEVIMYQLILGDCLDKLRDIKDSSIESCVTDPPYHLTSITKRFGKDGSKPAVIEGNDGSFSRLSKGFMNQEWDGGDIAFRTSVWLECYRVLKPGSFLLAFSATRNYHRMAVAIEDSGFIISNSLVWLFATGFPKGQNIGKFIDKKKGVESKVIGSKLGLKGYASNPSVMVGKNPRVYGRGKGLTQSKEAVENMLSITTPTTEEGIKWDGWNTQLKPAMELIVMAQKPMIGTYVENILTYGVGAINIDGCRLPTDDKIPINKLENWSGFGEHRPRYKQEYNSKGRYPSNVLLDQESAEYINDVVGRNVARFYYSAKASKKERDAGLDDKNIYCTVKPIDLMRYLIRLVTPKNGKVLDPFMGSGSTGCAAVTDNIDFVGVEINENYFNIATKRIEYYDNKKKDGTRQLL